MIRAFLIKFLSLFFILLGGLIKFQKDNFSFNLYLPGLGVSYVIIERCNVQL